MLLLQFFWKLLAAAGKPGWQSSAPISLNCPGTVTDASVAVCPNGTVMVAQQTLERPNRLQVISVKGDPTLPTDAFGAEAVECHPVGEVGLPDGAVLLEAMFEPQSGGVLRSSQSTSPSIALISGRT